MADTDWTKEAQDDAKSTAENFLDEIVENIISDLGETGKTDINDYSDSYHHENHVDKAYGLVEAATLIDELHDYEETDSGLWEGLDPKEAIGAMAAFTYGNAVASMFNDLMSEINDAVSDAEGETIFWSAKEWVERSSQKDRGVLDWVPTDSWDALTEEQQDELDDKWDDVLKKAVKDVVKEAIERW